MSNNLVVMVKAAIQKNPIFIMLLGLCPTLAVTSTLENGIGMGLATSFVLIFSCSIISIIRKFVPQQIRIPSFIVIIATFVTIISMLMEAYTPDLFNRLGIYIPLIVVNCIVLGKALSFSYKNPLTLSLFDALGTGLGFTGGLIIIAGIREIIGQGTIQLMGKELISIPLNVHIMVLPPGALLTVGLLLAAFNWAGDRR
ncbi:MAG: electron transport complex subunit RsxE [Candidatus Woesearchaeota archaeon]